VTADHSTVMTAIVAAMRMLSAVDVAKAIENANRAQTVGPFLDPTLYREKGRALEEDKKILMKALPLWRQAQEFVGG
jgi:hypothetical protein